MMIRGKSCQPHVEIQANPVYEGGRGEVVAGLYPVSATTRTIHRMSILTFERI